MLQRKLINMENIISNHITNANNAGNTENGIDN